MPEDNELSTWKPSGFQVNEDTYLHEETDLSTQIDDPEEFLDAMYQQLLSWRPCFPGSTNTTGHCIDALLEVLHNQGARSSFERD